MTTELENYFSLHKIFDPLGAIDKAYLYQIGVSPDELKDWRNWSPERKSMSLEQLFYKSKGIEVGLIDGLIGKQTRYAREVYAARQKNDKSSETWRDSIPEKPARPIGSKWPLQSGVPAFFGKVGENQVPCITPFPLVIAWDIKSQILSYSCHKLVKAPMERVWQRTLDHYGLDKIRELRLHYFGGCLNVRKMRGGSNYSMHSWGIAIDIDPDRNGLHTKWKDSQMSKPEYKSFVQFWYDEGFINLGKEKDFDSMHFQACHT